MKTIKRLLELLVGVCVVAVFWTLIVLAPIEVVIAILNLL